MGLYDSCSREELIRIIEGLKTENDRLASGHRQAGQAIEGGNEDIRHRFKEKYATKILESLPDMLTVLDHSGVLVDLVSSEETNHVGEPGPSLIGKHISNLLSPEAYQNVKANLDLVVATNEGSTSHHDITLDGHTCHYENRIFPLDGENVLCMCRDVTDEVIVQEKLEQMNRRMSNAENIASLAHWFYYEETDEIEAPELIRHFSGIKDKNMTRCDKQTFLSYVYLSDREKVIQQLSNPKDAPEYLEFRISLEGKIHYYHSRVIHSNKKNGYWVVEGYTQDMTYIVEQLHELKSVKYALNNAAEEIFACHVDGTMVFANQQFMVRNNLTGDISKLKIYEFESQISDQKQWQEKVARIREGNGTAKYTARYKNGAGEIIVLEIVTYSIVDKVSGVETIWSFSRDVSYRVEQENKIRELNYVMETILNNIPVYLFMKDPGNEFRYLYWNKAFAEFSQIPESKALGHTDYEIFPRVKDADQFRKDDLDLLKHGERVDFIEEYQSATGELRIVKTSKVLVPSEDKLPLIIGISWDITEMKKAEQELIAARVKAEESDRLKSAFLANMSHEIRTPLNAIVGFSKLVAEADNEEDKQQYSSIVDSNSELLLQLINDILDISKIEAGTLEFHESPMSLNDLCKEQFEVHKNRVQHGVKLVFEEKYQNITVNGDHNRLAQVITNLINNAIKFTYEGEIRYGFDIVGGMIRFYVTDTGTGIPETKVHTIFDRFVKLNNFASGTGLGLAISKMIVEKSGGTISVESKECVGTTFTFTLPYENGKREEPVPVVQEREQPRISSVAVPKGKKILVAEDIDSNYMLIKAFMGTRFDPIWARNGKEAVEMFKTERPDIILMDIKMPEMTGHEATKIIRTMSPDVPIIALTAFAFESDKEKALSAGCNDYLTKPISQAVLIQTLEKYLGEK